MKIELELTSKQAQQLYWMAKGLPHRERTPGGRAVAHLLETLEEMIAREQDGQD